MFSIGQNLKHVHMIYSFPEILMNSIRYLLFGVDFSPHQRSIVCEYKLQSFMGYF